MIARLGGRFQPCERGPRPGLLNDRAAFPDAAKPGWNLGLDKASAESYLMAKSSQQGVGSGPIPMIAFAALWLTSTVFLVILYTNQEDLRNDAARAQSAKNKVISLNEERSIELVKNAQEGGPTVAGLLEEARSQTAALATGDSADQLGAVRQKHDQILKSIQDDNIVPQAASFDGLSYHEALAQLYESFRAERDSRLAAEDRAAKNEGQVAEFVEASAKQKEDFEKRAQETVRQLEQCEADHTTFRTDREKGVDKIEKEFEESRKRNDLDLTKERQARAAAEKRLVDLQRRLAAQQERYGELLIGPEQLVTARQPDGRVLTAAPGDNVVYVNLGRKNGLILGLQFAVYSSLTGIPEDGRGKALVEVVSIGDDSSECRIVSRAPGQVIVKDDLIANPVYDPNRPLTFVVVGEFDLDRDGILDRDGGATLESLITTWGGQVSKDINPLTDFVVLGAAPKRPRPSTDSSAAGNNAADPAVAAWNDYNQSVDQAKTLAVPTLTQDVFLNFLGYGGRKYAAGK